MIDMAMMQAAIQEAREELAAGRLRHVNQIETSDHSGECFCMGIHRREARAYSIVSLAGLVERKLGLEIAGLLDVMRDVPDNTLRHLFYPQFAPRVYDEITPARAVNAIDRWLEKSTDVWGHSLTDPV